MQLLQCLFVTWRRQVILEVGHTNRADYESKVQLEVEMNSACETTVRGQDD